MANDSIHFTINQLKYILAYHWSFVLFDVIFYRQYKLLQKYERLIKNVQKKYFRAMRKHMLSNHEELILDMAKPPSIR